MWFGQFMSLRALPVRSGGTAGAVFPSLCRAWARGGGRGGEPLQTLDLLSSRLPKSCPRGAGQDGP